VHFDRRLGRTKIRPRKQRKAQIDRRAVERVHSVGEINPEVLRRIKFARAADQNGGEVGPHAPVAQFVRVGQRRFRTAPRNPMPYNFEGRARRQASMSRRLSRYSFARTPWCGIVQCNAGSARERLRHTSPQCDLNSSMGQNHDLRKQRPAQRHGDVPIGKIEELPQNRHPKFKSTPNKIHPNPLLQKAYQLAFGA